ncbi:MAG TPA: cation diffusion facilitator family transporter [Burkholderiales bacterium]|nr:cation diffusion facilitator family transporter [Burkholderiales bacterium]
MLRSFLRWLGFASYEEASAHGHLHSHDHAASGGHGHTHGVIDATIATTARGIWAIKWSFLILGITAALQIAVVLLSGSVALLADAIHNVGDAATAIPLWIAFMFARRRPSPRFTYGFGRVEDLAGVVIIAIILFSALLAGYEAIDRLIHPQPIGLLGWVVAAGIVGFVGNEAVAVFRIRVGRQINSAALIADGYHARTDGLTSLAVVLGAIGVWLGFPLADPIVGLLITLAILGIVWQSTRAVFTRILDGVEPALLEDIRHAVGHVGAAGPVLGVRARWLGHRLTAELDVAVSGDSTVREAEEISSAVENQLLAHIPALSTAHVRLRPAVAALHAGHHHAPDPVAVKGELGEGVIEILATPAGERLCFRATRLAVPARVSVEIERPDGRVETLSLAPLAEDPSRLLSTIAPAEPHEFDARLCLQVDERRETLPFRMVEPAGHAH